MKNKFYSMLGLVLAWAWASAPALALVEGVVDPNLASSPWAGVVSITPTTGGTFSGVLIDPWHVLTAAHVVSNNRDSPGNVVVNLNSGGDQSHRTTASQVFVHPSYTSGNTPSDQQFAWNDDLAVIRLSQPVLDVSAYPLFTGSPGQNGTPATPTFTMVAYGGYADGLSAEVLKGGNPSVKRTGRNQMDDFRDDDEGSGAPEVFLFDFDGPAGSDNLMGGTTLGDDVEAGYAGGDSGSPVFILDNGVWKIAGIAAFHGDPPSILGNALQFGAIGGGMLVAPYVSWIQSQQSVSPVPEPQTWVMLLAGLGLVGLAAGRTRR
jgi:secreted trypsin-like serine protease